MSERPVRDRTVVVVAAAVVIGVLGVLALSVLVPPLGEALSSGPVLIIGLIGVTVLVLFGALRPRRPA